MLKNAFFKKVCKLFSAAGSSSPDPFYPPAEALPLYPLDVAHLQVYRVADFLALVALNIFDLLSIPVQKMLSSLY